MFENLFKISLIAALLLNIRLISAQELDPLVDVDLSKLNVDVRDRLSNFQNDITNYLTRTRFTDENIVNDVRNKPYKIKCNFSFFFTGASGNDGYSAQVVISLQTNIFRSANSTELYRIK